MSFCKRKQHSLKLENYLAATFARTSNTGSSHIFLLHAQSVLTPIPTGLHLLASNCVFMNMNTPETSFCTTQVRAHSEQGALLVDVREPAEVAAVAFDAPEVINLSLSQLAQRWQELPKDRELVTVCFDGNQSQQAAELLLAQGFTNVHPMRGGILLWMQKGYPVIGKRFTDIEKSHYP